MQTPDDLRRTVDLIHAFATRSGRDQDGIEEIGVVDLADTDEQAVEVIYSNPEAPVPPRCVPDITERLGALELSHVRIVYVKAS